MGISSDGGNRNSKSPCSARDMSPNKPDRCDRKSPIENRGGRRGSLNSSSDSLEELNSGLEAGA